MTDDTRADILHQILWCNEQKIQLFKSLAAKRRKSERASKLFFSFDIYNSHAWTVLPLQTICSLPTHINVHSLPLSCSRTTHASLSTFCPLHQLASSLGRMNAFCELTPIKGVFAPWSTKFGLVFFSAFLLSSVVSSRQSLPFCEGISGPGMWSGHLWTKEHSCSRSCCLLIIRKNECAVALDFQLSL